MVELDDRIGRISWPSRSIVVDAPVGHRCRPRVLPLRPASAASRAERGLPRLRPSAAAGSASSRASPRRRTRGDHGQDGHDQGDAEARCRSIGSKVPGMSGATIVCNSHVSYRELLKQTKDEIDEVDARYGRRSGRRAGRRRARGRRMGGGPHPRRGRTYRAVTSSRGSRASPADRTSPLVVYCASGARSAFAAKTLGELGYTTSLAVGRLRRLEAERRRVVMPRMLSPEKRARYARHIAIPEIGEEGQLKLLDSRVLLTSARAASARRPRSTSPRPASDTSGSSTQTSSTSRTSSARSPTR